LLALRFTIGCILLCVIFHRRLAGLNKSYFIKGGIIGTLLFLGYSLQTIGITDTTPGKNAFLTTIYCVIVPFLFWAVDRKKPDIYNIVAAFTGITGIGFVSLNGGFSICMGDAFTLLGGFAFAGHLVAIAKFGREKDPILLTIVQFGYAAIYAWLIALLFEDIPTHYSMPTIYGILYLAVFATAVAILLQNIGQKYTQPAPAAIILSLESVFGVLFSVIFYHEIITPRLFLGFLLIFMAVIISETKLSFLFKGRNEDIVQE
jgi:drug/metabolite transporter (DMT)-like permease